MNNVTLQPIGQLEKPHAGEPVTLHFGHAALPAIISQDESGILRVPETVLEQWSLRPGQSVGLWRSPDRRHIHLGPLFGVVYEAPDPPVEEIRAKVVMELSRSAARAHVPLLCFSMHDVDLAAGTVTGQFYQGENHWQDAVMPLPDVIYNRATYPNPELRRLASQKRNYLHRVRGIPFVNPAAGFDKWTMHKVLAFFPATHRFTPASMQIDDALSFEKFLKRHRQAFIKANAGTWGQSVLKVSSPDDTSEQYRVHGYLRNVAVNEAFDKFEALFDYVASSRGQAVWVAQQAIDLLSVQDRRFDVRLVLQKDGQGQWQVAQRLINWAGPDQVVTNNRQTAQFLPAAEFKHLWPQGPVAFMKLVRRAERTGRLAAEALEAKYGLLGEMGLDIGFDKSEHPWVFESNAKPFLATGVGVRYPFEYARYLAEKRWRATYGDLS